MPRRKTRRLNPAKVMDQEIRGESDPGEQARGAENNVPGSSHDATDNHVVLRTLFRMLPGADLLKWRKVNKCWDDAARGVLNRRDRTFGRLPINLNSTIRIRDFLKMIKGRLGEYKVNFQSFILDVSLPEKEILTFLESMGTEIQDLNLDYDFEDDLDNLMIRNKILPRIASILPEVKFLVKLTLTYNLFLGSEEERQAFNLPSAFPSLKALRIEEILDLGLHETLASYIVERAPRLETIHLCQNWDSDDLGTYIGKVRDQIPALVEIAANKNPPPSICLRPLKLREYLIDTEASLDALSRTGPHYSEVDNIYSLQLHYPVGNGFMSKVNEILALQTRSLVYLDVVGDGNVDDAETPLSLVRMEQLIRLCLHQLECKTVSPVRPFVPGQFPVLQTIRMNEYRAEWQWFPRGLVIPTVNYMTLTTYLGNADHETWDISFPKLTRLVLLEVKRSISFVKFTLAKLTMTKMLYLLRLPDQEIVSDAKPGNLGKDLWTIYTGGEPNPGAGVDPVNAVAVEYQRVASLGNMKALAVLDLGISTTLELEALVLMSRIGHLPQLVLTIWDGRRSCQTRSSTRKTDEMLASLRNHHIHVYYYTS